VRFGAQIHTGSEVIDLRCEGDHHRALCSNGKSYTCPTILVTARASRTAAWTCRVPRP
jgi:glycine/D-amino acid oxidase-like deaminating enzyme